MAEHDGKVTFDLELDDSKLRGDLNRALGQIRGLGNARVKVEADTSGALTQLKNVQTASNDLDGKKTVTVDANTSSASQQLKQTEGALNGLTNGKRTITVDADTAAADQRLGATYGLQTQVDALDPQITVTADTSQAEQALGAVLSKAEQVNTTISGSAGGSGNGGGSSGGGVGNTLTKLGGAASVVKFVKDVFAAGMDYDYAMAKASTLFPEGADQTAFGNSIMALSQETGIAAPSLLESAYNALSASVPFGNAAGDNLVDFLRTSAALSVSGYASADDVTKVLGSIGNAYNGQYKPSEIANMAIKTQNKGQLTVADIVQSAPNFMSGAASQHIPLNQAMSMFAAMTLGGIAPAQAATAMNSLYTELQRPQSEGFKAMQGAFASNPELQGKNLKELMDSGVSMMQIVSGMDQYMTQNKLAPAAVLPGEALRAYNTLSGENMPKFQGAYEYISGSGNAMGTAYDIMMGTQQSKWGRFTNSLKLGMTNIAQGIKPTVDLGLEALTNPKGFFTEAASHSLMGNLFSPLRKWLGEQQPEREPHTSGWSRGGGAGRVESKIGNPLAGLTDTPQAAASLNTAMEDLSADIEASAESAQAATEAQEQIAESMDASAEANEKNAESAKRAAKQAETAASKGKTLATKFSSLSTSLMTAVSASSGLAGEIGSLVANIRAASSTASSGASVRPSQATAKAVGLDYVPYDNYPALLHKGEMILTAARASAFRANGGKDDGGAMTAQAFRSALAGMAVEIDGRRAGALMERSVSRQQGVRLNRMNSRG